MLSDQSEIRKSETLLRQKKEEERKWNQNERKYKWDSFLKSCKNSLSEIYWELVLNTRKSGTIRRFTLSIRITIPIILGITLFFKSLKNNLYLKHAQVTSLVRSNEDFY